MTHRLRMILILGAMSLIISLVLVTMVLGTQDSGFSSIDITRTSIGALNATSVAQLQATQVAQQPMSTMMLTATAITGPLLTPVGGSLPETGGGAQQEPAQFQRIVIRNASLRMVVADPVSISTSISQMVDEIGGWVVTSTADTFVYFEESYTRASATIRVPAQRLNESLERIKSDAIQITSENITGQDVTQDYVDLSSRLSNLQAAESQLQEIMQDAEDTQAVLAVYNELVRIRGEIETITGRLQYFQEAAAYSLITVNLEPELPDPPEPVSQVETWSPVTSVESGVDLLATVLRFLADLVIIIVIVILPLGLLVVIPVWLVYRYIERRNARRNSA